MATFRELTEVLLFGKDDYVSIYHCVHALHDFYAGVTGISASDTTDENVNLPTGKAISPGQAANCLLDLRRTAVFMRGIYKSILQLQKDFPDQPIHILYAGCGPYATLLTPITTMFTPEQIRYHLMDVQERSIESVKKLYEQIHGSVYVEEFIVADAATYRIDKPIHLVVVETMQSALMKEPQVAITRNLLPQLMEKAIFLPQEISITAQLLDREMEAQGHLVGGAEPVRINLGEVYRIGALRKDVAGPVSVEIPAASRADLELRLLTDITVFEDEQLGIYNCGITNPMFVAEVGALAGGSVRFEYEMGEKPGFKWEVGVEKAVAEG